MADGHLNKCKECTKSDTTKHRNEHLERIREYDRARSKTPKRLEKNRQVSSRWRKNNPIRRAAQVAVGNAVRDGRLVPTPCVECGAKAEAHHPDYSRPLDVVWLCPAHHKQTHALFNRLTKASTLKENYDR
jgi:hypothetical protein